MRNEILTPRDLFDNVDYYRNMRMSFDRNGGGNVWRYKHAENSIHVQSNAEHGGAAMPVRTARTVWRRVCVKFDFDADSYEVADCSDPYETRPTTSRHPSVSWRGGFRLEVCARTEAHARAIADYIGRLSEKPEFKRRPIGWLASRLTAPTLAHIDEDGSLTPGAPKWMELPERLA